ncbi:MAG: glycosyltransferase [Oligoflexia bacterium]|nr:glycosyltransferase [Oligoflexia bacterium]
MNTTPAASIFIRTFNEAQLIEQCLQAIFSQKVSFTYDVTILDCESTDETVRIARNFPVTIYSIPKSLFSYSKALNFGAQRTSGEFFVPLSAHAVPCNSDWLSALCQPLLDNVRVAGSYSRQIAWPEAARSQQRSIEREFPLTAKSLDQSSFFSALADHKQHRRRWFYSALTFSNVSSCIRRSFLLQYPFRALPFSEDRAFVLDAIGADMEIRYAPASAVWHSHPPSFKENARIAHSASLARSALHVLGQSLFPDLRIPAYSISKASIIAKLPTLLVWNCLATALAALEPGAIRHIWAQTGILAGKWNFCSSASANDTKALLEPADPAALLKEARKLA